MQGKKGFFHFSITIVALLFTILIFIIGYGIGQSKGGDSPIITCGNDYLFDPMSEQCIQPSCPTNLGYVYDGDVNGCEQSTCSVGYITDSLGYCVRIP